MNDLPNLKTALRTRSSASSMLEATLIICGANYSSDNAKIRDVRNQEFQVKKKVMYDSSDDDAAFESLHRHSWRHKDDEQVIDKFLITNNSTHVTRKTEHSSDAYLKGMKQCWNIVLYYMSSFNTIFTMTIQTSYLRISTTLYRSGH